MKKDMVYLFDIDGTLFDSSALIRNIFQVYAGKFSLDEQVLLEIKQEHREKLEKGSDFDPQDFLLFLSNKIHVPADQLSQYWNEKTSFEQSIYPDVLPVLHELQKKNIILGIFSEGNMSHQRQKLTHSGLMSFFDPTNIHIFRRKLLKESIDLLSKNVVVIDNQKEVVFALGQANLASIWINRNSDEKLPKIRTIRTLKELL